MMMNKIKNLVRTAFPVINLDTLGCEGYMGLSIDPQDKDATLFQGPGTSGWHPTVVHIKLACAAILIAAETGKPVLASRVCVTVYTGEEGEPRPEWFNLYPSGTIFVEKRMPGERWGSPAAAEFLERLRCCLDCDLKVEGHRATAFDLWDFPEEAGLKFVAEMMERENAD